MKNIKVVAFDADDTLWANEPYFRAVEDRFCQLLEAYMPAHSVSKALLAVEIANIPLYGYGIKGFMLSMIETAMAVTENTIDISAINKIIALGKEMLHQPVELLPQVAETLSQLQGHYRLVVATKGDLLDQERKLKASGLEKYFHHVEIMSEKEEKDYEKLINHLDIKADEFLMVGNSIKSDILPVLRLGGHACHIPYHTTWAHEVVEAHIDHPHFHTLHHISEVVSVLKKNNFIH